MNFLSLFTVFTENKCVKFKKNDYGKSEKPRRNVGKKKIGLQVFLQTNRFLS